MRRPLLALLPAAAVVLGAACTDATGAVQGGEPLQEAASLGEGGSGGTTWTSLYQDYFGPSGSAGCAASAQCHQSASGIGAQTSGFVCGASKDECWQGMTQGIGLDAGGLFCPIVCLGTCAQTSQACPTDPTQQQLWSGLHKSGGGGLNNMPCGNPTICSASASTYTFTSDDLARIQAWIQAGAPND